MRASGRSAIAGLHSNSKTKHAGTHDTLSRFAVGQAASNEAQGCVIERGGFRVCLAESPSERSGAAMLIERRYSWRGYLTQPLAHLPSRNRLIFAASSIVEQEVFGTLTLGLDSEEGLLADALYKEEIDVFRSAGRRVCEVSKFAVDPRYGSKEVFASLFHLAYIYAHHFHQATDAFIEVNPRHAAFYQRQLGFRRLGDMRICPRVNAPAVLLHLNLAYIEAHICPSASSRTHEKSLYPYFFATGEEGPSANIPLAA